MQTYSCNIRTARKCSKAKEDGIMLRGEVLIMAYFGLCISLTTLQVECGSVGTVQNMTMVSKLPVILRKEQ